MALTTIKHKGKTIYYNDWRNLKNLEQFKPKILDGNNNTRELIRAGKTNILTLTDITNSYIIGEVAELLREASKLASPITKKSATVGLSAVKKIILNGINLFANSDIKAFDTIEEAKSWLVKD